MVVFMIIPDGLVRWKLTVERAFWTAMPTFLRAFF
jgi:hypothetical protein